MTQKTNISKLKILTSAKKTKSLFVKWFGYSAKRKDHAEKSEKTNKTKVAA